jgi:exonuclease III
MELSERKIDIMGLCETKLSKENQHFAFLDQKQFKCFSSAEPHNPRSAGVSLLIRKNIERFIASVDKIEGHLIAINLLNKGYRTWIAQIYLPSNKRQSRVLQKKIQSLLQTYSRKNYEIIIMGDFNATANPRTDRKSANSITEFIRSDDPEIELFDYMNNWNLSDLHQLWEPTETSHTWKNKTSSSRIDYIWGSYNIANSMLQFSNEDFRETSNSDHTMLTIQIARNAILKDHQISTDTSKPPREKIINTAKTTDSQWKKYIQKVDQKL